MRKTAAALLTAALAAGGWPAWAADPAPQKKLEQVQQDLRGSEERKKALEAERRRLETELRELTTKSVAAARAAQAQEEAVSAVEQRLAALLAEEAAKSAALDARRQELAATLDGLARLSRQPPESLLLAPGSAIDTVRSSQLLAALTPEIADRAAQVRRDLDALATLRREVAAEDARLNREIAVLGDEQARMERLRGEVTAARAKVANEQKDEQRRAQALAREAGDLKQLIDRLAEEDRRRREAEARARAEAQAQARAQEKAQTHAHAQTDAESETESAEAEIKPASLALPARGRLASRYGDTTEAGLARKGIVIETRPNAQVTAPADGKVAFAGPFKGYGQLLILAHSGGYHSLLSGLAEIDVAIGQRVVAGEPVARMPTGTDGGKPMLYLELRRRGEPVNPLPWLARDERKASG